MIKKCIISKYSATYQKYKRYPQFGNLWFSRYETNL